jgi:GTP-binding protein LepA
VKGERIKMMASGAMYNADNIGVFTPANEPREALEAGEVGYIIANIKELQAAKVGDTVTLIKKLHGWRGGHGHRSAAGLSRKSSRRCSPGCTRPKPASTTRCATRWKSSSSTIRSLRYEPEVSQALGFGFPLRLPRPAAHGDRAGAAGARVRPGPDHHRAERGLPGGQGDGEVIMVENPSKMPDQGQDPARSASRSSPCTSTCRRNTSAPS